MEKEIIGRLYIPQDNSWVKLLQHEGIENFQGLYYRPSVIESEPYKEVVEYTEKGDTYEREFVNVRSLDTGLRYRVMWKEDWMKGLAPESDPKGIIGKWFVVDNPYAKDLITGEVKSHDWVDGTIRHEELQLVSNPYEVTISRKEYFREYYNGEKGNKKLMVVNVYYEGRVYAVLFDEWHIKDKHEEDVRYKWL